MFTNAQAAALYFARKRRRNARIQTQSYGPDWLQEAYPGVSDEIAVALHFDQNLYFKEGVGGVQFPGSVVRASVGNVDDLSATWTEVAANILRRSNKGTLAEEARTYSLRNSDGTGAVVGTIGSGGVLPNFWTIATSNGVVTSVVARFLSKGFNVTRIRFSGTPTATSVYALYFDAAAQIAATNGQSWAQSAFIAQSAGSQTNITTLALITRMRDGASGNLGIGLSTSLSGITSDLLRYGLAGALSNASLAFVQNGISFSPADTVTPIDLTIDIMQPQLTLGAFIASPFRNTTAAATRAGDVVSMPAPAGMGTRGTMLVQVNGLQAPSIAVARHWLELSDGTTNNRIILQQSAADVAQGIIQTGGVTQASISFAGSLAGRQKIAIAWSANDVAVTRNGAAVITDASVTVPPITTLHIGNGAGGALQIGGYVEWATVFSSRLSNAQLQALTAG